MFRKVVAVYELDIVFVKAHRPYNNALKVEQVAEKLDQTRSLSILVLKAFSDCMAKVSKN
jgi:hypothetical protein